MVYMQNTTLFRSTDGGETTESINNGTHGDFHDLWIDPDDPTHLVVGNDGGGAVTHEHGGRAGPTRTSPRPSSITPSPPSTSRFTCAARSRTTAPSASPSTGTPRPTASVAEAEAGAGAAAAEGDITAGAMEVAYQAGGGEPGYIAPDPLDVDIFYSGTNNGGYIDKYNRRIGTHREVNPYPWFYSGEPSSEIRERWQWTFPILFSPIDPNTLYTSSQRLWRTTDGGKNWTRPQRRPHPARSQHPGAVRRADHRRHERPRGLRHHLLGGAGQGGHRRHLDRLRRRAGARDARRRGDLDQRHATGHARLRAREPDRRFGLRRRHGVRRGEASAAERPGALHLQDQRLRPDLDEDRHGIRDDAYVHAVREDPTRRGLLYAGTQHGVYISYDDGALWQPLNPNLPDLPIVDLIVEDERADHQRPRPRLLDPGQHRAAAAGHGRERRRRT